MYNPSREWSAHRAVQPARSSALGPGARSDSGEGTAVAATPAMPPERRTVGQRPSADAGGEARDDRSSALRLRAPGSCQQRRPASVRHSSPAPTSMSESSFRASVSPRVSARSAPAFIRSAHDPRRMPAERPETTGAMSAPMCVRLAAQRSAGPPRATRGRLPRRVCRRPRSGLAPAPG